MEYPIDFFARTSRESVIGFSCPMNVVSWSIFNGGSVCGIRRILNRTLRSEEKSISSVEDMARLSHKELPAMSFDPRECVVLYTTVSQIYLQIFSKKDRFSGLIATVFCTVGLGNAMAPGDKAIFNEELERKRSVSSGTINIIVVVNRGLTLSAQLEMISIVTMAKASVLSKEDIRSPISSNLCLGTGTDCIAICSPQEHRLFLENAGMYSKIGELVASAVIGAVSKTIEYKKSFVLQKKTLF